MKNYHGNQAIYLDIEGFFIYFGGQFKKKANRKINAVAQELIKDKIKG